MEFYYAGFPGIENVSYPFISMARRITHISRVLGIVAPENSFSPIMEFAMAISKFFPFVSRFNSAHLSKSCTSAGKTFAYLPIGLEYSVHPQSLHPQAICISPDCTILPIRCLFGLLFQESLCTNFEVYPFTKFNRLARDMLAKRFNFARGYKRTRRKHTILQLSMPIYGLAHDMSCSTSFTSTSLTI